MDELFGGGSSFAGMNGLIRWSFCVALIPVVCGFEPAGRPVKHSVSGFLVTSFPANPVSSPYHPATLRHHYELAAADKAAGEKFYQMLADYKDRDALVLGYKAAAEAIRARDASMFNKLAYVQDATRTFEQAVGLDPQNPEIRFLRFSVESNLPAFLGLSKHVDEDKELLLTAALSHPGSGLDAEAFRAVRSFLVARGHVSDADAERLNKLKE